MFSNETRLNHLRQLYLYMLKYDGFSVYEVTQQGASYLIKMAKNDKTYGKIPIHDLIYVLSPVPDHEVLK